MKNTHISHPFFSFALVTFQFAFIIALLLTTSISFHPFAITINTAAAIIGLWALQTMHWGHFNIIPDPMPEIELVTTGPYQFIRHPMYFSIILFFLPLVLLNFSLLSVGLYINLTFVLLIKLHYEEYLLSQVVADYPEYQKRTKKLIPFIL